MTNRLSHVVFVYRSRRKPHKTVVVYHDDAKKYNSGYTQLHWRHIATLDPAAWIEYFLNHPEERQKEIEGLMK